MEKKHLVINLIGGPGAGKSTEMAGLFYFLKKKRCKL
jgi:Tfp pilus assembly ATPase PilU